MTHIRRLDHVAVLVHDTAAALAHFSATLGLAVVAEETRATPPVRLTYLDCGNAYLQLVEPLDAESPVGKLLAQRGEGLHHICFGADDVAEAVAATKPAGTELGPMGGGRGRPSMFVPGDPRHGVPLEFTAFSQREDVEETAGWLLRS